MEGHRVRLEHLDLLQRTQHGGRLLGAMVGVQHILDVGLHGLGIEPLFVVEEHILSQMEGIRQSVWRDLPVARQARHKFAGLRVLKDERVVNGT